MSLTLTETTQRIEKWADAITRADKAIESLYALVGMDHEAPLFDAVYRLMDRYTEDESLILGDENYFLSWYHHACEMGRHPQEAAAPGGKMKIISTARQLAKLIRESQ